MGYETAYNITWSEDSALQLGLDMETIFDTWLHDHSLQSDFMDDGSGVSPFTWHDDEADMADLSSRCPELLFTLTGFGAEPEDIWKLYARNGECQRVWATIEFPPCTLPLPKEGEPT